MPPSLARNLLYSLENFHILKSSCLATLVKFCVLIYKEYNHPFMCIDFMVYVSESVLPVGAAVTE